MLPALIAIVWLAGAPLASTQAHDKEAVERAKRVSVRALDRRLPERTLEAWLRDVFGPARKTVWEVNDCGEQTGDPRIDRGRDLPMCVDAKVSLDDRRVLHVVVAVGSLKTGVGAGPPRFAYASVIESGTPIRWLTSLPDVRQAAAASRERQ